MASLSIFPVEVLEHILFFLPLEAWKQASLVCRQWISLCSSRKCMANVLLKLEPDEQEASEICRLLASSNRKYRHILYKGDGDEYDVLPKILNQFKHILESLRLTGYYGTGMGLNLDYLKRLFRYLNNLRELRIQTMIDFDDDEHEAVNVKKLKVRMAKMPHLRILYLESGSLESACFNWREIAPNLKHLYMPHGEASSDFHDLMRYYGPQLSSLGISFEGERYFDVGENVTFPHVRQLSLKYQSVILHDRFARLLKSFANLVELSLGHNILLESLSLIAESYPTLVTLRLYDELPDNGLKALSKLPNLKHLFLSEVMLSHTQLAQAECFMSLEQLGLKNAEIDEVDDFFALIPERMPKVTCLEINENDQHHAAAACRYLCDLQKLTIAWIEESLVPELFGELHRLKKLLDLRLLSEHSTQSGFSWAWFTTCPSIRKIVMSFQQLTLFCSQAKETEANQWKAFADNFPSLDTFEIAKCELPPSTVELIRQQLPKCDVRHISVRAAFQADTVDATLHFSSYY